MTNETKILAIQKDNFVITKRIAKHGNQAVIIVPRVLERNLTPGTIVEVTFKILQIHNQEKIKERISTFPRKTQITN